MKILLAIKDPQERLSLGSCLRDWKHQILEADTASDLSQFFKSKESLDLAIIDPGISGVDIQEFCKISRNKPKAEESFLIVLTTKHDIKNVPEYIVSGFDGYLISPVGPYQLKAQISLAERALKSRHIIKVLDRELDEQIKERTAELIEANHLAEETSRLKSEFLANMSHEIRTPLNGIISLADLVRDSVLSEQEQEDMDTLYDCAMSLKAIVGDILDFSKIEAGKLAVNEAPFSLRQTIHNTLRLLDIEMRKKRQELLLNLDEDIPDNMIGDPLRIQQILTNLVANAIKFTPEEGGIIVRVTRDRQDDQTVDLLFTVADTGIGIPLEKQEMIFEAFTQVNGSITRKYGGTGLGLTICAKLSALMGGQVWFESKKDIGTAFHFFLPLKYREQGSETVETKPDVTLDQEGNINREQSLHVLVVDDNAVNRNTIERTLRKLGYSVISVTNGQEALDILAGRLFDVILMDIQMPVMDGLEATQRIRSGETLGPQVPIIAITASVYREDADRCLKAGADAYMFKPIDYNELVLEIEQLVKHYGLDPVSDGRIDKETALSPCSVRRSSDEGHSHPDRKHSVEVLLVEDEELNRNTMVRNLKKFNLRIATVENGREALEILEEEQFDIVLMDLRMPFLNGLETTKHIRNSSKNYSNVPIVVISAFASSADKEQSLGVGADAFVTKPVDYQKLASLIEDLTNPGKNSTLEI